MSYVIASLEGEYDKYIALIEVLEVICCLSKNTAFYATNYLEYYNFLDQIQAYYIDTGNGKISVIDNAKEIIKELFQDIKDTAPLSTITRDLPKDLSSSLCDIYFIDDDLNSMGLLQKFGGHNFTNELDVNSSVYKLYQDEKDVVIDKLYEFASKQLNVNSQLLSINKVPELIRRFHHHFIICNDELRLVSIDELVECKTLLEPKTINSKLYLVKNNSLKDELPANQRLIDISERAATPAMSVTSNHESEQRIAELEKQLEQAKADNAMLKKQLDDNKELEPSSIAAVTRLLNVLFYKLDYDVSAHSGTLNKQLIEYSKHPSVNTKISKGFLAPWLKRVQQLRIDTKTGSHDRHTPL